MSPAERQRAYRAHRRAGKMWVRISIDNVATPAALAAAGYLAPHLVDDRRAVAEALQRAVADLRPA